MYFTFQRVYKMWKNGESLDKVAFSKIRDSLRKNGVQVVEVKNQYGHYELHEYLPELSYFRLIVQEDMNGKRFSI